jgi:methylphosphotriester-DNA--protein-cysteine methyltransferase
MEEKLYKLLNENGEEYISSIPGMLGGNKRLKIYGRLNCPSANRWISKGYYVQDRVFFKDEETAINAGYRPCAICMRKEYKEWKEKQNSLEYILKRKI